MSVITFERHQVGEKGHVEYPVAKHFENSLRGSRHFKKTGHKTTDLDMLPDLVLVKAAIHAIATGTVIPRSAIAGHIPNEHWPEPLHRDGFHDPKHELGEHAQITKMVPEQWGRLVAHGKRLDQQRRWPRFHILPIERQLELCPKIDLQVLMEPKRSLVWLRQEVWDYLAEVCEQNRTRAAVYSMMHTCLPYARRSGFNAWAI
jgi:hypothetical protein